MIYMFPSRVYIQFEEAVQFRNECKKLYLKYSLDLHVFPGNIGCEL